jgi:hypothetical protein
MSIFLKSQNNRRVMHRVTAFVVRAGRREASLSAALASRQRFAVLAATPLLQTLRHASSGGGSGGSGTGTTAASTLGFAAAAATVSGGLGAASEGASEGDEGGEELTNWSGTHSCRPKTVKRASHTTFRWTFSLDDKTFDPQRARPPPRPPPLFAPRQVYHPESEAEVVALLAAHHASGERLRVVGSGRSPNGLGLCDDGGSCVNLAAMDKVLKVDKDKAQVFISTSTHRVHINSCRQGGTDQRRSGGQAAAKGDQRGWTGAAKEGI